MKKKMFYLLITAIFCSTTTVYAHPGRTDSNGCHTCRTNCERWGLSYGQYHCHNGGSSSRSNSSSRSSSTYSAPSYVYGCTDKNSINYNPNANKDNGSCIKKVNGCTDKEAYNYNEQANVDDGSCIAKIYGCTDSMANNYNNKANTADGSCLYTKYDIKYKSIKYKTKHKYKFFTKKGTVLRKGKNGRKKVTTKYIVNESGEVIERFDDVVEIIKKPIKKIVVTKKK